jgi:hypothetical protein
MSKIQKLFTNKTISLKVKKQLGLGNKINQYVYII